MQELAGWVTDPLQYEFMQRALLVAVVAGIACAVLSCWLTLLGWSLMGDAVSHAVLPGVVLSYVFGLPFAIGAFIFGSAAVAMIGGLNRTSRIKEDAAIGIVFTGLFALGLILVSTVPSQTDLFHILFGNVLGVSDGDIIQVVVIGIFTIALLLFFLPGGFYGGLLVVVLFGVGLAGLLMLTDLLVADLVDDDELKTGRRREGMFFGINGFVIRFAFTIQGILTGLLLELSGYVPAGPQLLYPQQPAAALFAMRLLIGGIPALAAIIAFFILRPYSLRGERLRQVQQQIAARHLS